MIFFLSLMFNSFIQTQAQVEFVARSHNNIRLIVLSSLTVISVIIVLLRPLAASASTASVQADRSRSVGRLEDKNKLVECIRIIAFIRSKPSTTRTVFVGSRRRRHDFTFFSCLAIAFV